jgi:gamma-glutamyltranspeptidase/glutathione hydrolase
MCPSLVTRAGKPLLAIGGRGGRRIPNAVFEALLQFVVLGGSLPQAMAAPRSHTEGSAALWLEKHWPEQEIPELRKLGYTVSIGPNAVLSAVARGSDGWISDMR